MIGIITEMTVGRESATVKVRWDHEHGEPIVLEGTVGTGRKIRMRDRVEFEVMMREDGPVAANIERCLPNINTIQLGVRNVDKG